MRKIEELRGYEKRQGELHLFAVYADGSYKEIDPEQVTAILNKWFKEHSQLKIADLAPAPDKAG